MGYQSWYETISAPFRNASAARLINILDKALVYVIAAAYVLTLAFLAFSCDARLWKALIVPAVTFAIITALRHVFDKPRPYEVFDIDPIIFKDTRGKSMPSRHLASAVIIACTLAWINPIAGVIAFVASVVVAFTRIIGGIHFPIDIVAAAAISLACGLIGFVIIP